MREAVCWDLTGPSIRFTAVFRRLLATKLYTLHVKHYTYHTIYYMLHITHYTVHMPYCTLQIRHYTSHTAHYTLQSLTVTIFCWSVVDAIKQSGISCMPINKKGRLQIYSLFFNERRHVCPNMLDLIFHNLLSLFGYVG